jgi:hypothetical protein
MFKMTAEWVIGVVFGGGVLLALFQITGVAEKNHWRLAAMNYGSLLLVGALLVVTAVYVTGTYYISKYLTSSVRVAWLLWVLLMLLPSIVYVVLTTKFTRR